MRRGHGGWAYLSVSEGHIIHLSCIFCDQRRSCKCGRYVRFVPWIKSIHNIRIFLSLSVENEDSFGSHGNLGEDNKEKTWHYLSHISSSIHSFSQSIHSFRTKFIEMRTNGDAW